MKRVGFVNLAPLAEKQLQNVCEPSFNKKIPDPDFVRIKAQMMP